MPPSAAARSPMNSSAQPQFRFRPRARIARAVSAWARSRQGEDHVPLTLHRRRIYILPTRPGLVAAGLLFVMLLAGLNYNNSLALLLCFLLCGVVLVSMYECHRTLSGLQLISAQVEATFAQREGELLLGFQNDTLRVRRALRLRVAAVAPKYFDLDPHQSYLARIGYQALRRGRQPIDRLHLSTDAPLGLFRAWTWLHLPLEALVYPQPLSLQPLPAATSEPRSNDRARRLQGEEEWAWLRPFQDSDPPRSIAWKAFARGGPLLVAQYDAPTGAHRVLSLRSLREMSLEPALSQLAEWVLACERYGENYALELPDQTVVAGHGLAQRRACLEALALYEP
jgi:uncharacterized protein (DUF58 family)